MAAQGLDTNDAAKIIGAGNEKFALGVYKVRHELYML